MERHRFGWILLLYICWCHQATASDQEAAIELVQAMISNDLIATLISKISLLDFEVTVIRYFAADMTQNRKTVAQILCNSIQRQILGRYPAADYFAERPDLFTCLIRRWPDETRNNLQTNIWLVLMEQRRSPYHVLRSWENALSMGIWRIFYCNRTNYSNYLHMLKRVTLIKHRIHCR